MAIAAAERGETALLGQIARRRLGELTGRRALIDGADRWLRGQGVADPVAMARTAMPGFRDAR